MAGTRNSSKRSSPINSRGARTKSRSPSPKHNRSLNGSAKARKSSPPAKTTNQPVAKDEVIPAADPMVEPYEHLAHEVKDRAVRKQVSRMKSFSTRFQDAPLMLPGNAPVPDQPAQPDAVVIGPSPALGHSQSLNRSASKSRGPPSRAASTRSLGNPASAPGSARGDGALDRSHSGRHGPGNLAATRLSPSGRMLSGRMSGPHGGYGDPNRHSPGSPNASKPATPLSPPPGNLLEVGMFSPRSGWLSPRDAAAEREKRELEKEAWREEVARRKRERQLQQKYSGPPPRHQVTAKQLYMRLVTMQGSPPADLTEEMWNMSVWDMLRGQAWQQRVFSFGNSVHAHVDRHHAHHTQHGSAAGGYADPSQQQWASEGGFGGFDGGANGGSSLPLPSRYTSPTPLSLVEGVEFISVAAGREHGAAVASGTEGHVYVWGSNRRGQLGLHHPSSQLVLQHVLHEVEPVPPEPQLTEMVPNLPATLLQGIQAAQGQQQQAAGPAAGQAQQQHDAPTVIDTPRSVARSSPASPKRQQQQGGAGGNDDQQPPQLQQPQQQRGAMVESNSLLSVYRLKLGAPVAMVACGAAHTLVAMAERGVWAWGNNSNGQVGVPGPAHVHEPICIPELQSLRVVRLSGGQAHSAAVSANGDLWTWGDNSWGQCGVGSVAYAQPPVKVKSLNGKRIIQAACGTSHTLALSSLGEVYAWGCNASHQLGFQDTVDRPWPTKLTHLPRCVRVVASSVSMAVSDAARLYIWGYDYYLNPGPEVVARRASEEGVHSAMSWTSSSEGGAGDVDGGATPRAVLPEADAAHPQQPQTTAPPVAEPSLEGAVASGSVGQVAPGPRGADVNAAAGDAAPVDLTAAAAGQAAIVESESWAAAPRPARSMMPLAPPRPPGPPPPPPPPPPPAPLPPPPPPPPAPLDSYPAAGQAQAAQMWQQQAAAQAGPMPSPLPSASNPTGLPPRPSGSSSGAAAAATAAGVSTDPIPSDPVVREVTWLQPERVKAVACGSRHAVVITTSDRMYVWGDTRALSHQMLSNGHAERVQPPPPPPGTLSAAALWHHTQSSASLVTAAGGAVGAGEQSSNPSLAVGAGQDPWSTSSQALAAAAAAAAAQARVPSLGGSSAASGTQAQLLLTEPSRLAAEAAVGSLPAAGVAANAPVVAPVGVGGASLTQLNAPARGTGVFQLFGSAILSAGAPAQERSDALSGATASGGGHGGNGAHNAREGMWGGDLSVPASVAADPSGVSMLHGETSGSTSASLRVRMTVFNGYVYVGMNAVAADAPPSPVLHAHAPLLQQKSTLGEDFPEIMSRLAALQDHGPDAHWEHAQPGQARAGQPAFAEDSAATWGGESHWSPQHSPNRKQPQAPSGAAAGTGGAGSSKTGGSAAAAALDSAAALRSTLHPRREPVFQLACGDMHTLCLCAATRYAASREELLSLSLMLLQQFVVQQQQAEAAAQQPLLVPPWVPGSAFNGTAFASGAPAAHGGLAPQASSLSASAAAAQLLDAASADDGGEPALVPPVLLQQLLQGLPKGAAAFRAFKQPVISMDVAFRFCRQAGLLDNHTEFLDIAAAFIEALRERSIRAPPSARPGPPSAARAPSPSPPNPSKDAARSKQQVLRQQRSRAASPSLSTSPSRTRPGDGPGPTNSSPSSSPERTRSPSRLRLVDAGPLLVTGKLEPSAVRALDDGRLSCEELLAMMIGLMQDRHPAYAGRPDLLLRLLCKRHLVLLERRAPSGLTWLQTRCMSPKLLQLLDSGETSELLHRVYVFLSVHVGPGGTMTQLPVPTVLAQAPQKIAEIFGLNHAGISSGSRPGTPVVSLIPTNPSTAPPPSTAAATGAANPNSHVSALIASGQEAGGAGASPPSAAAAVMAAASNGAANAAAAGALPAHGEPSDLHLSLRDARRGLRQHGQPFRVPLLRVVQFLRQAGLIPRVVSKMLTELQMETEEALSRVPVAEMTPWWWQRTKKSIMGLTGGIGAFRFVPGTTDPLQQSVLMAILNEFDILGITIPKSRRAFSAVLTSEINIQIEQKKRDRLLAYVLAHMLGEYFLPITDPDQLRPSHLLNMTVTYPQFVEAVAACLVMRCASTQDGGSRLLRDVRTAWPASDMTVALAAAREGILSWRDKLLCPWKYVRVHYSDSDLELEVDKAFSLYCNIDPLADKVGITAPALQRLMLQCGLLDNILTVERLNNIFVAAAQIDSNKLHDFGGEEASQRARAARTAYLPPGSQSIADWGGITTVQLQRLQRSKLAMQVAQQALEEHLAAREAAGPPPPVVITPGGSPMRSPRDGTPRSPSPMSRFPRVSMRANKRAAAIAAWRSRSPLEVEVDRRASAHMATSLLAAVAGDPGAVDRLSEAGENLIRSRSTSPVPFGGAAWPIIPHPSSSQQQRAKSARRGSGGSSGGSSSRSRSPSPHGWMPRPGSYSGLSTGRMGARLASPPGGTSRRSPSPLGRLSATSPPTGGGAGGFGNVGVVGIDSGAESSEWEDTGAGDGGGPPLQGRGGSDLNQAVLLQRLQEQDISGAVSGLPLLQRWPSFRTEDFAASPSRSPVPSPHRSPERSPHASAPPGPGPLDGTYAPIGQHQHQQEELPISHRSSGSMAAGPPAVAGGLAGMVLMPQPQQQLLPPLHPAGRPGSSSALPPPGSLMATIPEGHVAPLTGPDHDYQPGMLPRRASPPRGPGSPPGAAAAAGAGAVDGDGVPVPEWLASSASVWQAPDSAPSGDQLQQQQQGQQQWGFAPPLPQRQQHQQQLSPGGGRHGTLGAFAAAYSAAGPPGGVRSPQLKSPQGSVPLPPDQQQQQRSASRDSVRSAGQQRKPGSPPKPEVSVVDKTHLAFTDALNRLTTTRAHLGALHEGDEKQIAAAVSASVLQKLSLTRAQFGEALRRVAVAKYAKISSPTAAWRILVERHVVRVAEAHITKFDTYLSMLMGPSTISLLLAWEPQLKQLFNIYSQEADAIAAALASSRSAASRARDGSLGAVLSAQQQRQQQGGKQQCMSFVQFLQLCQDRQLIPAFLKPSDLEEIFRRVNFMDNNFTISPHSMGYPQFVDAAALTGLFIFSQSGTLSRLPGSERLKTAEQKLEAFFAHLCGLKPPRPVPTGSADTLQMVTGSMPNDPYKEWWTLATTFNPAADNRALSYLSSLDYTPVLIQESVLPPGPCPPDVTSLLDAASRAHNEGDYDGALAAYGTALAVWRGANMDPELGLHVGLRTDQKIYFGVVTAAVHLSAGRPEDALTIYDSLAPEVCKLPEDHPNVSLLHSAVGFALNATDKLELAYEHYVRARVLRCGHPDLGPGHVDTALAAHNLGCVLDRLGKTHKAVELIQGALQVFSTALGDHHPRTETAYRNLHHVRHKCTQLEMHYQVPAPKSSKQGGRKQSPTGKGGRRSVSPGKSRAGAASSKGSRGGDGGGGSDSVVPPAPRGPKLMTPQQRLAAFQLRRVGNHRYKRTTDLDYLGGGLHSASPDMVELYEKMKPLIAATAAGRLLRELPEDVVLLQHASHTSTRIRTPKQNTRQIQLAAAAAAAAAAGIDTPAAGSGGAAAAAAVAGAAPASTSPRHATITTLTVTAAAATAGAAAGAAAAPQQQPLARSSTAPAGSTSGAGGAAGGAPAAAAAGADAAAAVAPGTAAGGGSSPGPLQPPALRVAIKGGINDATLAPRHLDRKSALALMAAGRNGMRLPPVLRPSSRADPTGRKRGEAPHVVRDRLADFLAPKPRKEPKKRLETTRKRSPPRRPGAVKPGAKGSASAAASRAASSGDEDDDDDADDDDDDDDDQEDEDDGNE